MTFKQVMGYIYLFIFIGAMGYKFYFFTKGKDGAPFMFLIAFLVLMILFILIRRIIRDE